MNVLTEHVVICAKRFEKKSASLLLITVRSRRMCCRIVLIKLILIKFWFVFRKLILKIIKNSLKQF